MYRTKNYKTKKGKSLNFPNKQSILRSLLFSVLCAVFIFSLVSAPLYADNHLPDSESFNKVTSDRVMLYPGGMPFGVRFNTRGLIVSGISHVMTENGAECPAAASGLRTGDIINSANKKQLNSPDELGRIVEESGGNKIDLCITRGEKTKCLEITPQKSEKDGLWRIGIFVRNECAGIGTVSYIQGDTLAFAGLGHGICDRESGELIPFLSGNVTTVVINEVVKGRKGSPGELRGHLSGISTGKLTSNLHTGIYGVLSYLPEDLYFKSPLPAACEDEIHEGEAEILCTTDSDGICKYKINIEKIDLEEAHCKNFKVKITDSELIAKTGGIVQGMSGSPIIQDGRIIGAITHVLVDDPTEGYGIFIENMLNAAPKVIPKAEM